MKTFRDEDLYWSRPRVMKTSTNEELMKTSTDEDLS